jgi:chemotaxis protein MotB
MNKLAVATLALALAACGHTEEEWQAQLGRYRAEIARSDAKQREITAMQGQVMEARNRVGDLEQQLAGMGVDIATKDKTVEQLTDDLAEVRRALDSYKARARALEAVRGRLAALRAKLDELTKIGLAVNIRKNRMIISLPGDVLFDTGKTELKPSGKAALARIGEIIRNDPSLASRDFQVAGHTDNKPLQGPPFFDNWGLSVMRARQVVLFLTSPEKPESKPGQRAAEPGAGVSPYRWSAAGFADTDPVASNSTPEGMQKNRRVELIVMPNVEEMLDLRSLTEPPGRTSPTQAE